MILKRKSRVDIDGRAFAGSQRQIQTYVNECPDLLTDAICDSFGASFPVNCRCRWVSPLSAERYIEYRDGDFLGALGFPQHIEALSHFWPNGGPCWDALARIEDTDGNPYGCILVEAKSHVPEFYSNDTRAGTVSLQLIKKSLAMAKDWFGVEEATVWTGFPNPEKCLYQYTNRLAHLYFFRAILGIPALLANVHFVNDPHSPTEQGVWETAITDIHCELGLHRLPSCFAEVFLPAKQ